MSAAAVLGKAPPFPLPEAGATLTYQLPNNRWIDVICTELDGRDEQVVDFRDVTAAKQLEEAKDLFLATTSHELRTPITVVQGFASTLANRWDKLLDTDRRSAVQTIAERAQSLARLVDQLLVGSRAVTERLIVTHAPFDLATMLRNTAVVFQPLSDKHTLRAELPDDLPLAYGDSGATDSIVSQLIENAVKYSPDGGTITVGARADGEQIEVTVADRGIGIAPGDTDRVFDRFFQGEAGDRRRFGGIGLGLYIVRQLARAQGGDVTAAAREGGGTVMRLTLRRAAADGADLPAGPGPGQADAVPRPAGPAASAPAASAPAARAVPAGQENPTSLFRDRLSAGPADRRDGTVADPTGQRNGTGADPTGHANGRTADPGRADAGQASRAMAYRSRSPEHPVLPRPRRPIDGDRPG